jgi:hypothetical protein
MTYILTVQTSKIMPNCSFLNFTEIVLLMLINLCQPLNLTGQNGVRRKKEGIILHHSL